MAKRPGKSLCLTCTRAPGLMAIPRCCRSARSTQRQRGSFRRSPCHEALGAPRRVGRWCGLRRPTAAREAGARRRPLRRDRWRSASRPKQVRASRRVEESAPQRAAASWALRRGASRLRRANRHWSRGSLRCLRREARPASWTGASRTASRVHRAPRRERRRSVSRRERALRRASPGLRPVASRAARRDAAVRRLAASTPPRRGGGAWPCRPRRTRERDAG